MSTRGRLWFSLLVVGFLAPLLLAHLFPWVELDLYDRRLEAEARGLWSTGQDFAQRELHHSVVLVGTYEPAQLGAEVRAGSPGVWTDEDTRGVAKSMLAHDASGVFLSLANPAADELSEYRGLAVDPKVVLTDSSQSGVRTSTLAPDGAVRDLDGNYRQAYLAEGTPPRPTAPLVFLARFLGVEVSKIEYGSDFIQVGQRKIRCLRDARGWRIWVKLFPIARESLKSLLGNGEDLQVSGWELEPIPIQSLRNRTSLVYAKAPERFFFLGDYTYEATGERPTPLGKYRDFQYQGVVLDTLIKDWNLHSLPLGLELGVEALWAWWCIGLLSNRETPLEALGNAALLGFGLVAGNFFLFHLGWLLPLAAPLLMLGGVLAVTAASSWGRSISLLQRFGGRAAAAAAAEGRLAEAEVEVDEREATILFTNLPDYLKHLEHIESPQIFDRRREYSETISHIVSSYRGLVHDYQADYLMIGFGTEIGRHDPDHADQALHAGLEMVQAVAELAKIWPEVRTPQEVDVSIGLCTGLVAVGFVGSARYKRAPAAIGDTTNVAARLLVMARKLKLRVLLHERTQQLLPMTKYSCRPLPPVELKGKSKPVPVFTLEDDDA